MDFSLLKNLPPEIVTEISQFLDRKSVLNLALSCKFFGNIIFQNSTIYRRFAWTQLSPDLSQFRPHESCWPSCVYYNNKLFIYGGHLTDGNMITEVKDQFCVYDLKLHKWHKLTHHIEPKTEHPALVFGKHMFLAAGYNRLHYTNYIDRVDLNTLVPTRITNSAKGTAFSQRSAVTMCVRPHTEELVFFGGWNGEGWFNDLVLFNLKNNTFTPVVPNSDLPPARTSHSASIWEKDGCMYIFGGYSGDKGQFLNDLYKFDFEKNEWINLSQEMSGDIPAPRSRMRSIIVEDRLYVLGGWNKVSYFYDFFMLDLETLTWYMSDPRICKPPPLSQYSVAAADNGLIYFYGGFNAETLKISNSLYAFNPAYFPK